MSDPILPLLPWESGTNENSLPANTNWLRIEAITRGTLSDSTTAQPGSPSDGDVYIIASTHTGAQWATFTPGDIAIYRAGNWSAWAPVTGLVLNVAGTLKQWTGSAWTAITGGGGGSDRSTVSALATTGSVGIDYSLGDYFTLALAGNVSGLTFSNLPGSGHGASLMIRITQDSTPRTVAWPASFKWAGGVAGVVSTGSGAVDVLAITTFDNGTTWDATLAKAFA